jgi:hypothetical protein
MEQGAFGFSVELTWCQRYADTSGGAGPRGERWRPLHHAHALCPSGS